MNSSLISFEEDFEEEQLFSGLLEMHIEDGRSPHAPLVDS